MRYLGGKSRLGKHIARAIREHARHAIGAPIWEPFCGGLGCTPHLATLGPVICSDVNPALISLYRAVRAGWVPPDVTEGMYRAARTLPDSDPLKAFAGFGVSFGGKWFGGYARNSGGTNYSAQSRNVLLRQVPTAFSFDCWSFFAENARAGLTLYLDPPYANTEGYEKAGAFDSQLFWTRAAEWSRFTHVYVSEFNAPPEWFVVWEKDRNTSTGLRSKTKTVYPERLFWKGPSL